MRLQPCDQSKIDDEYRHFYEQSGRGYPIAPFQGSKYQAGHGGLGSIFSSLFKVAVPMVKKLAAPIGKTLLRTGVRIAKDKMAGKTMKDALSSNLKRAGSDMLQTSINTIVDNQGQPPNKRKRRRTKRVIKTKTRRGKRSKTKDIFS